MKLMTIYDCLIALRQKSISASELTRNMLRHIDQTDGRLGAYLTLCRENALSMAEKADEILRRGENIPPLCGIPYACKDNFTTKGIRTTCASRILEDFVPPYDAAAVERINNAGGVLLGKTNMDEFAMGSAGENSALGRMVHPLDDSLSPGGSSGGSAAAVASGEAIFALGSDTGGSARQPAAFCGLVSMKPSYGLVSRYGLVEFASSMDTVCPMTHTVADNRLVLSVLAAEDPRDMTTAAMSEDWYRNLTPEHPEPENNSQGKHPWRIGFVRDFADRCDPATRENTYRAARLFADMGAEIEEITMPMPEKALAVYVILTAAESSSNLARYDGIRYGRGGTGDSYRDIAVDARTSGFGEEVTRRILTGAYALSAAHGGAYFHTIKGVQQDIRIGVETLLAKYDMLLMPTTGAVAFPLSSHETPEQAYVSDQFTIYANLTGLPAIQLPSGGDGRLPTGVSLLGRRFGETELYRAAACLEASLTERMKEEVKRYACV